MPGPCPLQIYQASPQVLLPILPMLSAELLSEDEAKRSATVALLVRLLCLPDSDIAEQYPELLAELLGRWGAGVATVAMVMMVQGVA